MIHNAEGLVAVRHYISNPTSLRIHATDYVWSPQHNVSLAWVSEAHLPLVLAVKTDACCGNVTKPKFWIANANDVSIWDTGHLP